MAQTAPPWWAWLCGEDLDGPRIDPLWVCLCDKDLNGLGQPHCGGLSCTPSACLLLTALLTLFLFLKSEEKHKNVFSI